MNEIIARPHSRLRLVAQLLPWFILKRFLKPFSLSRYHPFVFDNNWALIRITAPEDATSLEQVSNEG